MSEVISIPDGWTEARYEVGDEVVPDEHDIGEANEEFEARYVSDEYDIAVEISDSINDELGPFAHYVVRAVQTVQADGYRDDIESHSLIADDREEAEQLALLFMQDVNEGEHILFCLEAEIWESFVQFYCIDSSRLPDDITVDDVVEAIESGGYVEGVGDEVPDDDWDPIDDDDSILVDVYPVPEESVATVGDDI